MHEAKEKAGTAMIGPLMTSSMTMATRRSNPLIGTALLYLRVVRRA